MDLKSILIGVISSILAAFLVYLFKQLIDYSIKRFIVIHDSDVNINCEWIGTTEDPDYEEIVTINRVGENITGEIKTIKGKYAGREYIFEGKYRNLILTATYKSKNKNDLERGSFSLQITDIGNTFEGYALYCDDYNRSINSTKYKFIRK